MNSHAAIINSVRPCEPFLDYLLAHDMCVVLTNCRRGIKARLEGAYRFHPPSYDGPESTSDFEADGATEKQALIELACVASGREYCRTVIHPNWSIFRRSQQSGDGHLPYFTHEHS